MPVTDPDTRRKLLERGIDPDLAEEVQGASLVNTSDEQSPPVNPTPVIQQNKPRSLLSKVWDAANYQFVPSERMRELLFSSNPWDPNTVALEKSAQDIAAKDSKLARVGVEAQKGISDIASGVVTPLGIGTLEIGPVLKGAQVAPRVIHNISRTIAAPFAVQAGANVVQAAPEVYKAATGEDPLSAIRPGINVAGSAAIATLAGKQALTKAPIDPLANLRAKHMASEPLVSAAPEVSATPDIPSIIKVVAENPQLLALETGSAIVPKGVQVGTPPEGKVTKVETEFPPTEVGKMQKLEKEAAAKKAEADRLSAIAQAEQRSREKAEQVLESYKKEDAAIADYFKLSQDEWNKLPNEAKAEYRNRAKEEVAQGKLEAEHATETIATKPAIKDQPIENLTKTIPLDQAKVDQAAKDAALIKRLNVQWEIEGKPPLKSGPATLQPRTGIYAEEQLGQPKPEDLIKDKNLLERNYLNSRLDYSRELEKFQNGLITPDELRKAARKVNEYHERINNSYPELFDKARNQELSQVTSERQAPIVEAAKEQGVSLGLTKAWDEAFRKLGVMRHTKVDSSGRVTKADGTEVSGEAFVREGIKEAINKINPNKAGLDTYPHELFHVFYNDLLRLGNKADISLVEKANKAIEGSEAYSKWKAARETDGKSSTSEEYLSTLVGEDTVRRALQLDKKGAFKNWTSDFWSHVKSKFGKATDADYARLMSRRLTQDLPFSETFAKKGGVISSATQKEERQEVLTEPKPSEEGISQPSSDTSRVGVPGIDTQGNQSPIMSFEDPSTKSLQDYSRWLREIKGLSSQEAFDIIKSISNRIEPAGELLHKGTKDSIRKLREEAGINPDNPFSRESNLAEESLLTSKPTSEDLTNYRSLKQQMKDMIEKGDFSSDQFKSIWQQLEDVKNKYGGRSLEPVSQFDRIRQAVEAEQENKGTPTEIQSGVGKRVVEDALRTRGKFAEESLPTKLKLLNPQDVELAKKSPVPVEQLPVERQPRELYIPKFRAEIDKIKGLKTPDAEKVADSFSKFYNELTRNRGKFTNVFNRNVRSLIDLDKIVHNLGSPLEYIKQSTPELEHVVKWLDDMQDNGKSDIKLTEQEIAIRDEWRRVSKQVRDEQNSREGLRKGGYDENYFPMTPARSVVRELQQNPDSAKSIQLKKDFLAYKDNNQQKLDLFIKGHSKDSVNIAEQFGPIDKAEGIGIPPSWREPNFFDRVNRYLDRVSRRLAYYDTIENTSYDAIQKLRGNQQVRNVYNDIIGVQPPEEAFRSAAMGIVRAGMLGPLTGAKDFVSNLTLGMQHQQNPIQTIRSAVDAWSNMKENITDSFETGRNRVNLNALEWDRGAGDIINVLKRTRDIISEVQGRNWLEQMTRATAFGMGRFTTLDFMQQAINNRLSSAGKKWFKDFAKDIPEADWSKMTPEQVKEVSAKYVDSVQGTYDYRGLPHIAVEGSLSPVFALARWNIEKSNNFVKFVVNPLINGNPRPFLMATVGAVIGGMAVTKLVEEVTGRKEKTPKIGELVASYKEDTDIKKAATYKAIGLASLSGYAGMIGDLAKTTMDLTYGKNRPQWYNNVLLEFADNVAHTGASLVSAINEDGHSPELYLDAASKILEDNIQAYRIILAHTSAEKKEDIERANKFRDLRVFNTIEGNGINDLTTQFVTPLGGEDMRQFKRTGDIKEAAELLPKLIGRAIDKAEGNPEKLKSELEKIKRNSYQTMPSPERMPISFIKYVTFLEKTQGEEAAKTRLVDYLMQNAVNKAKVE